MKRKIVGILVIMLLIATAVLPVVGILNEKEIPANTRMGANSLNYPIIHQTIVDGSRSAKFLISHIKNLDLKKTYKGPDTDSFPENSAYDLVIIAPSKFSSDLQELVDHKNSFGMNTILKTTENIYSEYSGVDKPEQIKYFIKDALDTWNIKYVMLVGGMKSLLWGTSRDDANQGTADWYLPVRYTNLKDAGAQSDPGLISDLYYADIYDSEGNFSSWDLDKNGNSDGIFANWKFGAFKDILDLYPDVCVGRLACRNNYEVKIMVDKIITYESSPADPSWFKKMVVVGGESFEDPATNYLEGELICDKALSYMTDFTPVRIYASNRDSGGLIPSAEDIISTVSEGCGFLFLSGFGNPSGWTTHWPGVFSWEDAPEGIDCYDFLKLSNKGKLPICIVNGAWNSQFNVTLFATYLDEPCMHAHGIPIPECWSWWLTRKIGGGSIATMGGTGLGSGYKGNTGDLDGDGVDDPDCVEGLSGYMGTQFFKIYSEGKSILGEVFGETLKRYLDTFPGMDDKTDCITVEHWTLLGDPSLKIGGYS